MGITLPEIKIKGWNALVKELGLAGATKFILLYEVGKGDYTKQRKALLKDISFNQMLAEITKSKKRKK